VAEAFEAFRGKALLEAGKIIDEMTKLLDRYKDNLYDQQGKTTDLFELKESYKTIVLKEIDEKIKIAKNQNQSNDIKKLHNIRQDIQAQSVTSNMTADKFLDVIVALRMGDEPFRLGATREDDDPNLNTRKKYKAEIKTKTEEEGVTIANKLKAVHDIKEFLYNNTQWITKPTSDSTIKAMTRNVGITRDAAGFKADDFFNQLKAKLDKHLPMLETRRFHESGLSTQFWKLVNALFKLFKQPAPKWGVTGHSFVSNMHGKFAKHQQVIDKLNRALKKEETKPLVKKKQ